MMLSITALVPPSCRAMLPQKFSAATTCSLAPAPAADADPGVGAPARPQPASANVSASARNAWMGLARRLDRVAAPSIVVLAEGSPWASRGGPAQPNRDEMSSYKRLGLALGSGRPGILGRSCCATTAASARGRMDIGNLHARREERRRSVRRRRAGALIALGGALLAVAVVLAAGSSGGSPKAHSTGSTPGSSAAKSHPRQTRAPVSSAGGPSRTVAVPILM